MTTDLPAGDAPSQAARPARPPLPWGGIVREGAVVIAVFAVAGAGAGWLWQRLATPPSGVAYEGRWLGGVVVQGGSYATDYTDLGRGFGLVAVFVVIGLLAGTALGILAALRSRSSEIGTLVAVTLGSALATVVAYRTGVWLGPPDPEPLASAAADGTVIPGAMELLGRSPFVVWTLGALAGLTFTYVLTTGVEAGVTEARRLDDGRPS